MGGMRGKTPAGELRVTIDLSHTVASIVPIWNGQAESVGDVVHACAGSGSLSHFRLTIQTPNKMMAPPNMAAQVAGSARMIAATMTATGGSRYRNAPN